jgi:hypothetical protein
MCSIEKIILATERREKNSLMYFQSAHALASLAASQPLEPIANRRPSEHFSPLF